MNFKLILQLKHVLAVVLATTLMSLSACSDGDNAVYPNPVDPVDPPAEQENPMTFYASVEPVAEGESRMLAQNDIVTVAIDGQTKQYNANNEKLTSDDPFMWKENEKKQVSAWHFGNNKFQTSSDIAWEVATDQTKGFEAYDLLYAARTVNSKEALRSQPLKFYHQMAQIEVKVKILNDKKLKSIVLGENNIVLSGSFRQPDAGNYGSWTLADKKGSIRPQAVSELVFRALILPQNLTDKTLITLTMDDDSQTTYAPKDTEGDLKAGERRTFTVTIEKGEEPQPEKDKITVESTSNFDWVSGGNEEIATSKQQVVITYSTKEVTLPMITSSTGLPYGMIDWGDGSEFAKYLGADKHTFSQEGDHTIVIKTLDAEKIKVTRMVGLKSLDLTKF